MLKFNNLNGTYYESDRIEKRDLSEISLEELSLVDKPANKRRFLFFKSDSGDELDTLLSILEQGQFDSESEKQICKTMDVLTSLESDDRTSIAKTIMAILKLADVDVDDDTPVRKIDISSLRWPSLSAARPRVKKVESSSDKAKWPSLKCG